MTFGTGYQIYRFKFVMGAALIALCTGCPSFGNSHLIDHSLHFCLSLNFWEILELAQAGIYLFFPGTTAGTAIQICATNRANTTAVIPAKRSVTPGQQQYLPEILIQVKVISLDSLLIGRLNSQDGRTALQMVFFLPGKGFVEISLQMPCKITKAAATYLPQIGDHFPRKKNLVTTYSNLCINLQPVCRTKFRFKASRYCTGKSIAKALISSLPDLRQIYFQWQTLLESR